MAPPNHQWPRVEDCSRAPTASRPRRNDQPARSSRYQASYLHPYNPAGRNLPFNSAEPRPASLPAFYPQPTFYHWHQPYHYHPYHFHLRPTPQYLYQQPTAVYQLQQPSFRYALQPAVAYQIQNQSSDDSQPAFYYEEPLPPASYQSNNRREPVPSTSRQSVPYSSYEEEPRPSTSSQSTPPDIEPMASTSQQPVRSSADYKPGPHNTFPAASCPSTHHECVYYEEHLGYPVPHFVSVMSYIMNKVFDCMSCNLIIDPPVTGPCGHSRCRPCVELMPRCPCGHEANAQVANDVLVQRMIKTFFRNKNSQRLREIWNRLLIAERVSNIEGNAVANATAYVNNNPTWYMILLKEWLENHDLECILCVNLYRSPVTTPCGHTFCRVCIERTLAHRFQCPLCGNCLQTWDIDGTRPNMFLKIALEASGIPEELDPSDENYSKLPIFVCTVAYPKVPCPLYVYEPRYRLLIKRCLLSGLKQFGMVVADDNGGYVNYGTILEIRDCVRLPCGGYIVSTMGISRFRVRNRAVLDGYDVADVDILVDIPLLSPTARKAQRKYFKILRDMAVLWLRQICRKKLAQVQASYGNMPSMDDTDSTTPDGPAWTWWLMALLPFSADLKVMILSSQHLHKRMMSGIRSLFLLRTYRVHDARVRQSALTDTYLTRTM